MAPVTVRRSSFSAIVVGTLALIALTTFVIACSPPRENTPTPRSTIAAANSARAG